MKEESQGNTYYNVGQAGAVGPNSFANNFVLTEGIQPENLIDLAEELAKLRAYVHNAAPSREEGEQAENSVAVAERSARSGRADEASKSLSNIGTWVLDLTKKLSLGVAESVIKQALGIG